MKHPDLDGAEPMVGRTKSGSIVILTTDYGTLRAIGEACLAIAKSPTPPPGPPLEPSDYLRSLPPRR